MQLPRTVTVLIPSQLTRVPNPSGVTGKPCDKVQYSWQSVLEASCAQLKRVGVAAAGLALSASQDFFGGVYA